MHACHGSLVLQDLYVDRPLPYLIGSKAFMEQDDVGLGDLSSDGETVVLSTSPFTSWESVHHSHVIVCAEMSVDSDRELESGDDKESDVR